MFTSGYSPQTSNGESLEFLMVELVALTFSVPYSRTEFPFNFELQSLIFALSVVILACPDLF